MLLPLVSQRPVLMQKRGSVLATATHLISSGTRVWRRCGCLAAEAPTALQSQGRSPKARRSPADLEVWMRSQGWETLEPRPARWVLWGRFPPACPQETSLSDSLDLLWTSVGLTAALRPQLRPGRQTAGSHHAVSTRHPHIRRPALPAPLCSLPLTP